ncbi:NAD(P)-dependent oxidoreductase [Sphingomonas sp.]|uniref:NAD(P)-dependent oxidoreductase n=1 Tax=Sphingomonas sp. TaxID=28214 RepID=UPI001B22DE61|nr:NAD(P)-dependent oxidoreductase [Sphingomonas sp.]MBO9714564.1 NAD(P)-dependent oxidoreductase [Sphingomonas sp.]
MESQVAIIGFGEAGRAFATERASDIRFTAYDLKTASPRERDTMLAAYRDHDVAGMESAAEAVQGAAGVLSLVTADQALPAARDCAPHLSRRALWLDMNSVSPETKRAAAAAIEAAGGRYADVAVMAPVNPARREVPLLVSGPHALEAIALLGTIGFTRVRRVEGPVGAASAVKMIRSVMVKGLEALTAECLLAAEAAGVRGDVLASLDASEKPRPWNERANYNLDRMLVHGLRRAAEMEEVVRTLDGLGTGSAMSRGTVQRQRDLGELGLLSPPGSLDAKLAMLARLKQERAA